jgi:hypothetical protein
VSEELENWRNVAMNKEEWMKLLENGRILTGLSSI